MRISDWRSDVCSADLEQGLRRIDPGRGDDARAHEVADRHGAATRFQSKAGEAFKQDDGEGLEIAGDEGEDTDVERLLDEALDDVLVGTQRPEKRGDRHVDDDARPDDRKRRRQTASHYCATR